MKSTCPTQTQCDYIAPPRIGVFCVTLLALCLTRVSKVNDVVRVGYQFVGIGTGGPSASGFAFWWNIGWNIGSTHKAV